MIVEILNSAIEAVVDRIALNTMSFPDALKIWDPPQCCCHYRRRDYLVHPVMVAFWITFQISINLWFIVQFMVPKSPLLYILTA